ncbi:hypothetical protein PTSG_06553 [Salpingoeca rosetta]|uniref:Histone deacetylase complex subunit SAP30 Sin3 binding domain-containing protein n=1 Tax=Salpingoeca rosetta (strain ATCC 50818 / BSB-021) TaxID=946362 RepID=F2UG51_SALR5|nr:uncharacterized protein PTSG_06553 [Salpingoeca rosetta]EGD75479.1 hypothetical protein PTSG_06553 [Salpingoeca rosetta]|eukprot:XP_004991936.1 hypothetical protein PTSG_06553 [Salpingoeca rosetta]
MSDTETSVGAGETTSPNGGGKRVRGTCKVMEYGRQCKNPARTQPVHKSFRKNARKAGIRFSSTMRAKDPIFICDLHFEMVDRAIKSKAAYLSKIQDCPPPKVNFDKLPLPTLKKYKTRFGVRDNGTKDGLVKAVEDHFSAQHVSELDVILAFARTVRSDRNSSPPSSTSTATASASRDGATAGAQKGPGMNTGADGPRADVTAATATKSNSNNNNKANGAVGDGDGDGDDGALRGGGRGERGDGRSEHTPAQQQQKQQQQQENEVCGGKKQVREGDATSVAGMKMEQDDDVHVDSQQQQQPSSSSVAATPTATAATPAPVVAATSS